MYQLLQAVAFIHSRRYLHRDIKPGNLLLSNNCLKIADFGLARALTEPSRPYTPEVCTLWYRAPEILLLNGQYGPELDVWSCACIFYELITRDGLFKGDSDIDQIHKIFQILGTPSPQEWPEIASLLKPGFEKPRRRLADYCPQLDVDDAGFDLLEVSSFKQKMLVFNPLHRISANIALQHPYFAEFNGLELEEMLATSLRMPLTERKQNSQEEMLLNQVQTK